MLHRFWGDILLPGGHGKESTASRGAFHQRTRKFGIADDGGEIGFEAVFAELAEFASLCSGTKAGSCHKVLVSEADAALWTCRKG